MRLKQGTRIHEGSRQYQITDLTSSGITFKEVSSLQDHSSITKPYNEVIALAKEGVITIPVFDFGNGTDIDLLEREAELIQANHKLKGYEEMESKRVKTNERKRKAAAIDIEMELDTDTIPEKEIQNVPVVKPAQNKIAQTKPSTKKIKK